MIQAQPKMATLRSETYKTDEIFPKIMRSNKKGLRQGKVEGLVNKIEQVSAKALRKWPKYEPELPSIHVRISDEFEKWQ